MAPTNTQMLLSQATDLLTREAEKKLFLALRDARNDVDTLNMIEGRSLNQNSQRWFARQRVKWIKAQIVTANLPLVIRVAKRFACLAASEDILVSEGLMKLLQCVKAYNVDLGYKFSTYLQRPLYRHFSRYIQKEAKRNTGRMESETTKGLKAAEDGSHDVDELMEVLEANTAGLDALELTMICHFYGIGLLSPHTLKELSVHFGFSTGRLKKTLASAIKKLGNVLIERANNEVE